MMKGIKRMEERSLKVLANDTTFFNKISNTLTKLFIPTKVGLNGMLITLKRNAVLKAFETYKETDKLDEAKKANSLNRYEESYTLYLEAIDKFIMDSVYKKVKNGKATSFEKDALSNYYNVVHLKEKDYTEYKARKQKFLIDLDYESILSGGKEKLIKRYKELYVEKSDELYKSILKNYSVKLADGIKEKNLNQIEVYKNIFLTIEEYVRRILPLKLEKDFKDFDKIRDEYDELDRFDIGKLDEKDFLEKNMLLISMSRILFTHSLPLVAAENCYQKLLRDTRNLIITTNENKREDVYNTLLKITKNYNEKLLSTKVYWENQSEREFYKKFWNNYSNAKSDDEREIAVLKMELHNLHETGPKTIKIRQYYKNKLVEFGAMKQYKNSCKTLQIGKYIKKVNIERNAV